MHVCLHVRDSSVDYNDGNTSFVLAKLSTWLRLEVSPHFTCTEKIVRCNSNVSVFTDSNLFIEAVED